MSKNVSEILPRIILIEPKIKSIFLKKLFFSCWKFVWNPWSASSNISAILCELDDGSIECYSSGKMTGGTMVGYYGGVLRLGLEVRFRGWVQKVRFWCWFGPNVGFQRLVRRLGTMVGYSGGVLMLGLKVWFQSWVPILSPLIWSSVPRLVSLQGWF